MWTFHTTHLEPAVLRRLVSQAFALPEELVFILDPELEASGDIAVTTWATGGSDFPECVEVSTNFDRLDVSELDIARLVSGTAKVPVLIPDKSSDPYFRRCVWPSGLVDRVLLDYDAFERNEVVVARVASDDER